jgi:hypothetical protein
VATRQFHGWILSQTAGCCAGRCQEVACVCTHILQCTFLHAPPALAPSPPPAHCHRAGPAWPWPRSSSQNLHSTAQHSTAQHSTAQHSTAQHSTAQRLQEGLLIMRLAAGDRVKGQLDMRCDMSQTHRRIVRCRAHRPQLLQQDKANDPLHFAQQFCCCWFIASGPAELPKQLWR